MSDDRDEPERTRNRQGFLRIVTPDVTPFNVQQPIWCTPELIPPREWLFGHQLIRGFVSLLVAPGGTGKSSLMLGTALSLATGIPFLGIKVHQVCRVAFLNLEDPIEEMNRRIAAVRLKYEITEEQIGGRFFISEPDRGVNIASTGDDGFNVVFPDERAIIDRVREESIDVLFVDPFAECHTLEENSNKEMIQAAAAWRRVARFGNASVYLAHHVRKGEVTGIEAARGAKALSDSARVGNLLSPMTDTEADRLGIEQEQRLQYVRMDDAKANLSARTASPTWFRLDKVNLGNATRAYPKGDDVVVLSPWKPETVWAMMDNTIANEILDTIAEGLPDGVLYSETKRSPDRWAGKIVIDRIGCTDIQAAQAIATWLENKQLALGEYKDPEHYRLRKGLIRGSALPPGSTHE